jgi:hypothetical protein
MRKRGANKDLRKASPFFRKASPFFSGKTQHGPISSQIAQSANDWSNVRVSRLCVKRHRFSLEQEFA